MTLTRGINLRLLIISSTSPRQRRSIALLLCWSYSFLGNDVTRPESPNWHYSAGKERDTLTVHLRIRFASRGAEPGSYTATQLRGKLLTVVGHYAQWDWGKKKLGCCQPVFLFYWNIRLSWQKWMLPGITNEPINQWISSAAIKLMRAGWASSSRGYILGKVINAQNRQQSTRLLLSWTILPELFLFWAKYGSV